MKAVVNALIVEKDCILLVKRSWESDEPNMWSLPGGTVEGDESLIEALKRELNEELGISSYGIIEFFKQVDFSPEVRAYYFLLHLKKRPDITLEPDELSEHKFVKIGTNLDKMAFWQERILSAAN